MKGKPAPVLSEDEQQIEKLCDEERYLELHTDLAEKNMYEGKCNFRTYKVIFLNVLLRHLIM